uniref:Mitochondrial import receptor subunit TOM22 homolog n=1 Tax=Romanomermis culicivorax TaxID=13658 RepID=A0A915K6F5_ROMCU
MAEDDIIGDELICPFYIQEVVESVGERLIGLTEMFPEPLRNFSCNLVCGSVSMVKTSFFYLRQAAWVASATAIIGIMPYLIEKERFDYEEQIRQDERKLLLGPGAALSAASKHASTGPMK